MYSLKFPSVNFLNKIFAADNFICADKDTDRQINTQTKLMLDCIVKPSISARLYRASRQKSNKKVISLLVLTLKKSARYQNYLIYLTLSRKLYLILSDKVVSSVNEISVNKIRNDYLICSPLKKIMFIL